MKKLAMTLIVTLTSLSLVGCLTGQNPTPVIMPHVTGAAAAVNAYCAAVSEGDSELSSICDEYLPTINVVAGAADVALNLIFSVLTKRAVKSRIAEKSVELRSGPECHK